LAAIEGGMPFIQCFIWKIACSSQSEEKVGRNIGSLGNFAVYRVKFFFIMFVYGQLANGQSWPLFFLPNAKTPSPLAY